MSVNKENASRQTAGLDTSVRGYLDAMQAATVREHEIRDIQKAFQYSVHAMASEIWELRKAATNG